MRGWLLPPHPLLRRSAPSASTATTRSGSPRPPSTSPRRRCAPCWPTSSNPSSSTRPPARDRARQPGALRLRRQGLHALPRSRPPSRPPVIALAHRRRERVARRRAGAARRIPSSCWPAPKAAVGPPCATVGLPVLPGDEGRSLPPGNPRWPARASGTSCRPRRRRRRGGCCLPTSGCCGATTSTRSGSPWSATRWAPRLPSRCSSLGGWAAHIPHDATWALEHPDDEDQVRAAPRFRSLESLADVPALLDELLSAGDDSRAR